jgi:hypothetical protein
MLFAAGDAEGPLKNNQKVSAAHHANHTASNSANNPWTGRSTRDKWRKMGALFITKEIASVSVSPSLLLCCQLLASFKNNISKITTLTGTQ